MDLEKLGTVIEIRPSALYRVRLSDGEIVVAALSTVMRHAISRLVVGDEVLLRISQNDPHRGQIIKRAN